MIYVELIDEIAGSIRAFGRHIEQDIRSLLHAVEHDDLVPPKSIEWPRHSPILDQGSLRSCTGNAMTGWFGCEPHVSSAAEAKRYDEPFAVTLYSMATRLDSFPGEYPPDDTGSSGLAVAKAAQQLGYISSYAHAMTVEGLLHALQYQPVIVGVPWFEGMSTPDADGFAVPSGQVEGGHEFLIRGFTPGATLDEGVLLCDNSWGSNWALNGSFKMTIASWRLLRGNRADVVVPRI